MFSGVMCFVWLLCGVVGLFRVLCGVSVVDVIA